MVGPGAYLTTRPFDQLSGEFSSVLVVDRLVVNGSELSAATLRSLVAQVQQRALGERRLLFIEQAEVLSEILQNTLLKLLEEPGATLIIVLQTVHPERLLVTVRSRLSDLHRESIEIASPSQRLATRHLELTRQLQSLTDRQAAGELMKGELAAQKQSLLAGDEIAETAHRIELLERALFRLDRNANLKLTLDWFLLHWFKE